VYPLDLSLLLQELFDQLYDEKDLYRATGIILLDLVSDTPVQYSLFEDPVKAEKIRQRYEAADALGGKYGKHTLHLGGSHPIEVFGKGRRGVPTVREQTRMFGETKRKGLGSEF
jgi:DNA polymerase-4/DNA polymerase V